MTLHTNIFEIKRGIEELLARYGENIFSKVKKLSIVYGDESYFIKENGEIYITATSLSMAYFALGKALLFNERGGHVRIECKKHFQNLGIMLDCARNGVPNVEALKRFIICASLMGYTYLELYVEDCFEVTDEPYFGYMRSRYKKSELKELDEYCALFGIELVPCIQTLAHLSRIFLHWNAYTEKIQDKADVLLVGEERTYILIENMLKTCRECFRSNRINIGMDEAFELGRGKYFQKHGYVPASVIIHEHLKRVGELCRKYNYHTSLWADMFYEEIDKGQTADIPKDLQLIVWEYNNPCETYYIERFEKLKKANLQYSFAGAAHKWYGFAPHNTYSEIILSHQIAAAKKVGLDDFMITLWGDDGAECSYFAMLPTLAYLAEKNVDGEKNDFANKICALLTGYTKEEWMALDLPNKLYDKPIDKICNPSKYLLYVDAFMGVEEFSSAKDYPTRYALNAKKLKKYAARKNQFSYLFETQYRLCQVLELKATLTEDLDKAYKGKDIVALKEICEKRLPLLRKRLKAFIAAYKKQWFNENRPLGLEVAEYRLYGLLGRLECVEERLTAYLLGKLDKIPELEGIKLSPIITGDDEYNGCRLYNGFVVNMTYSTM